KESATGDNTGIPGRPLLAPKAREALDKGLQALSANKLAEDEKFVDEAVKLAPAHPDVLFVQGVLYLNLRKWTRAQSVREKAAQIELLVAQTLTAVGRYDDAAQTLREFLKSHGDSPEAATARRWLEGLAKNGKIR